METVQAKENIPSSRDEGVAVTGKLSCVTPRQPLVDLKQVSRPLPVEVKKDVLKCHTPLHTPRLQKSRRSGRPLNPTRSERTSNGTQRCDTITILSAQRTSAAEAGGRAEGEVNIYIDDALQAGDQTEGDVGSHVDHVPQTGKDLDNYVDGVLQKCLDNYVDGVLQNCIQDLTAEQQTLKVADSCMNGHRPTQNRTESPPVDAINSEIKTSKMVTFVVNSPSKVTSKPERFLDADLSGCTETFVTPNVSMSEESLLADVSRYSDCVESPALWACEGELLADTPIMEMSEYRGESPDKGAVVPAEVDPVLSDPAPDVATVALSPLHLEVGPPRPTFLERIAVTERVKSATSTVSSWVSDRDEHPHQLPVPVRGVTPPLLHDFACSPIMFDGSVNETNDSQDVYNDATNSVVQSDNVIVHGLTSEHNVNETSQNSINISATQSKVLGPEEGNNLISESYLKNSLDSYTAISTPASCDIACSPMLALRQNVTEMQSVMCSPMPIFVQHTYCETEPTVLQDRSMITDSSTPVKHSVMCSPKTPQPTRDVSIDNVPTVQSVQCSPIVPYSTQDRSIITVNPALHDACVGTAVVEMTSVAVDARPDTRTAATDMEELPMCTTATSMTPLKVNHKHNKLAALRVTAEDIRKQHPRAVANELDTLRLEAERHEAQLHALEQDRDKHRAGAREAKAALTAAQRQVTELEGEREADSNQLWTMSNHCAELEGRLTDETDQHKADLEGMRRRYEQAEADKVAMATEHAMEIQRLKEEFELTDYKSHFQDSQKLVSQLQSELALYAELVDDIDQSQSLQGELEKSLSASVRKATDVGDRILATKSHLTAQECEVSRQRAELDEGTVRLDEDRTSLARDRVETELSVVAVRRSLQQMEERYQATVDELTSVTVEVTAFSSELTRVYEAFEEASAEKAGLSQQVEELRVGERAAFLETQSLQAAMSLQEGRLADTTQRFEVLKNEHQKEMERNKAAAEQAELELINLQRTLDLREQDIDMHESDLFECRETIYTQMERIKALEAGKGARGSQLTALRAENSQLKDCCARLSGQELELTETLRYTKEELSGTKEHASRLLKQQGTELANCSASIGQLLYHMTTALANLNRKAGILNHQADGDPDPGHVTSGSSTRDQLSQNPLPSQQPHNSLVSLILNAAETQDEITEHEAINRTLGNPNAKNSSNSQNGTSDLNEESKGRETCVPVRRPIVDVQRSETDSPSTQSRKTLGFTGNSAFAPVTSGRPSEIMKVTDTSSLVTDGECGIVENKTQGSPDTTDNDDSLVKQVNKMADLFTEVIRVASLIEKASKSSLQDIRSENFELNSRVSQLDFTERRLVAELEVKSRDLEASRGHVTDLRTQLDTLGDRLGNWAGQEAEVKQLQRQVRSLQAKHQSLEGEKQLLNEQITELVKRLENASASTTATPGSISSDSWQDAQSQKQIMTLQKKVQHHREQLQEKQDFLDEISNKASRRIQKLEANWKKADSEVYRFDELVDAVRERLVNRDFPLRDNEEIKKIIRLIDGVEPLSSFRKDKSGDLKPIKTSKW